jgi:anti-sigma factor RsiW
MNCSRFETLLSDHMEGVLDPRVRAAVEQHLRECGECPLLVREVSHVRRELSTFPEVAFPERLVGEILDRTSGKPRIYSPWRDLILPSLRPFLTQRYAFATLMVFVFISFAVNVMGPGIAASSPSRLNPSALVARADELSTDVYRRWVEFNDLKNRMREEIRLFREDLFGRLDYHLVTILFRSYDETVQAQSEQGQEQQEDQNNEQQ